MFSRVKITTWPYTSVAKIRPLVKKPQLLCFKYCVKDINGTSTMRQGTHVCTGLSDCSVRYNTASFVLVWTKLCPQTDEQIDLRIHVLSPHFVEGIYR